MTQFQSQLYVSRHSGNDFSLSMLFYLKILNKLCSLSAALLQVYKPLRTFIALVGLEIWSNGDLISITPPAGANLNAFMTWRNSELLKRKKHDNAHLIRSEQFLSVEL